MPRTYANNAFNRSAGRAGMPVGSCVISKGSSSSSSSSGNSFSSGSGPSLGSAYSSGSPSGSGSIQKTHVDNAFNRSVAKPVGTQVISKNSQGSSYNSPKSSQVSPVKSGSQNETPNAAHKDSGINHSPDSYYKDNSYNRGKGRAGELKGTAVITRDGSGPQEQAYVDNKKNQKLGRVGKPRGSLPDHKRHPPLKQNEDPVQYKAVVEEPNDEFLYPYDFGLDKSREVQSEASYSGESWIQSEEEQGPKKALVNTAFEDFDQDVDFNELILIEEIGSGSFGKVHNASWKKLPVAVKILNVQRLSRKRINDFKLEIRMLAELKHHNIVQVFGACTKTPNLCIIMELMQRSLFEAIHMNEGTDFTENERTDIIRQTAEGLFYLHQNKIAHRDLKTANVLLNFECDTVSEVKLTDMALFVIKTNTESSQSCQTPNCIGTPRYSAPEVLRGESLTPASMQMADVYSLALLMFEVIFKEEPFYDLSYPMLIKQVGYYGLTPEIPDEAMASKRIINLLKSCWDFKASRRLEVLAVLYELDKINEILQPEHW